MLPVRALRPRTRGCEPLDAHTPGIASCGDATGRCCELVPIGETGGNAAPGARDWWRGVLAGAMTTMTSLHSKENAHAIHPPDRYRARAARRRHGAGAR